MSWRPGELFPPGESAADFHEPVATPDNPGQCEYCGARLEWNEGHGREYSIDCPNCKGPCRECGEPVMIETDGELCAACESAEPKRCSICGEPSTGVSFGFPVCDYHLTHGEDESGRHGKRRTT